MKKPIIGMISPRNVEHDRPFNNYTKFANIYAKRIIDAGGIPIGIVFPDGKFEIDSMKICDGFVLEGGPKIESFQINVVKYAVETKKPILGICLGMQTMAGFNWVNQELGNNVTYLQIDNYFKPEYEDEFLEKTDGHNKLNPFYLSQIEKSKHQVLLNKESRLYNIYKKDFISVPSLHEYTLKKSILNNSSLFKITGKSQDDIIEAIETVDEDHFMIGVQFHPELEEENTKLFKALINSIGEKNGKN